MSHAKLNAEPTFNGAEVSVAWLVPEGSIRRNCILAGRFAEGEASDETGATAEPYCWSVGQRLSRTGRKEWLSETSPHEPTSGPCA
jgi:hypothetical protein